MFDRESNNSSFLAGLITGSVIGSLAALLFAPKSGKELRKHISDKKDELLDDTNYLIDTAIEKSSSIITDATMKAEKLVDDGKKKVDSMIKDAESLISQSKGKLESMSKEAGDFIQGKDKTEDNVPKMKHAVK